MDTASSGTLHDVLTLQHDFQHTGNGPIGMLAGVPVRVDEARDQQNKKVLRVWLGIASPETAAAVRDAILADRTLLPVKPRAVTAADVGVAVDLPAKVAKAPGTESFEAVEAITQQAAAVPGATAIADDDAQLTIVDGFPRWLTAREREALVQEAEQAAQAYAATQTRLGLGFAAGAFGALVTAVVWALLAAYAQYQLWLVAIGGGLLVSFLAVKAAQRVTVPLQVGIFVLTLVGVAFGEILGLAMWVNLEFGVFDLAAAFQDYIALLGDGLAADALFALGGGLIGAFFGIRAARKPTFEREIQSAEAAGV